MNEILPVKKRMSIEEVLDRVTEIAQDSDAGADRFRALKMLASTETANVILPDPKTDNEMVLRVARVMHGAGQTITQLAYAKAFPKRAKADSGHHGNEPETSYLSASEELIADAHRFTSLKMLNKSFREFRAPGIPKGFPSGRSNATKIKWCQDQALKMLMERDSREREQAHQDLIALPEESKATDGGQEHQHPEAPRSETL